MDYIERKITVIEPSYVKPIYVVQGSNMREIRITLTDWDIPSGADVYWQVATNTKGELNVADVDGNTIYIRPYTSTFSEAGKGYLQVRVEHNGRVLISFSIDVYIQPDRVSNPTEGSNSDVIRVLVEQYVNEATEGLIEQVEAEVQRVIQSIPSDYTELESRVDELENADTGLSPEQQSMLIGILRKALYDGNQKPLIDALEDSFNGIIPITAITLSQSTLSINSINPTTLSYTITPQNGSDAILWQSSNTNVATVSNGIVTPVGDGSTTITAYTNRGVSATCDVTVTLPQTYSVTNNLTNATNSNASALAVENESYSGVITADTGYKLSTVTVTMGGTDVTSTVYNNGTVNIANVTGDIVITATAVEAPLYAFTDGVEENTYKLTVSNGNHIKIEGGASKANYKTLNFSHVGQSTNQPNTFFTVPNGATVVSKLKNVTVTGGSATNVSLRAFYKGTTTNKDLIANVSLDRDRNSTITADGDWDFGSVGMYLTGIPAGVVYEFDVEITVNGVLYIG